MGINLYMKECRNILKSILYFVFILVVFFFYISQLGNPLNGKDFVSEDINAYYKYHSDAEPKYNPENILVKPEKGQGDYGTKPFEVPEQVMQNTVFLLAQELQQNEFTTYPLGVHKTIRLGSDEKDKVKTILNEITGLTITEIESYFSKNSETGKSEGAIPIQVNYSEFKKKMNGIDRLLGGESAYSIDNLKNYGEKKITYEEKLKAYNDIMNKDKITGAYARLFSDYMGIVISLFAAFVSVAFFLKDKRSKLLPVIYTREITSSKLMIIRYLAVVSMTFFPFVILSMIPFAKLLVFSLKTSLEIDLFAFLNYSIGWLLPSILFVVALSMFITILTETAIGIGIQFLLGFWLMLVGGRNITGGNYGFSLAIRHNSLGNVTLMEMNLNHLIWNRVSFMLIAGILVIGSILIYELRRKGKINERKYFTKAYFNRKNSNKA